MGRTSTPACRSAVKPGARSGGTVKQQPFANRAGTTRPATMEDVARQAGVSRALVSLVMRGSPSVSAAKRTAVLESAAALGYSPNRLASRLASHRTKTLGVLFLDLHNSVFADIYDGLAEGIAGSGNQLMVAVGSADPRTELEAVRSFVDLRVDGVILAGYTGTSEELATALRGRPPSSSPGSCRPTASIPFSPTTSVPACSPWSTSSCRGTAASPTWASPAGFPIPPAGKAISTP
ncbi:catabolite control protein A [Arthrobacter sp. Hiyo4]|nr:catabolite control protein A [Arthrobacter sp. Hiyo4]